MPGVLNLPQQTRQSVQDRQAGFAGGLNSVADPSALAPNQARATTNFKLTTPGAALKRGGSQRVSAVRPNGATVCPTLSYWPGQNLIIAQTGAVASTASGSSTIPRIWTATTGVGAADTGVYVPFIDGTSTEFLYTYTTGVQLVKISSALVASAVAGTPTPTGTAVLSGLVVHNQRLWYWDGASSSIYYSALNNGDTLGIGASGGGQIIIRTFSLATVYSCFSLGASLFICHQKGLSRLTGFGQSDITVEPQGVTRDVQIIGRDAVVVVGTTAYIMTVSGLFRVTENEVAPVDRPDIPDPTAPVIRAKIIAGATTLGTKVTYNHATREVMVWLPGTGPYVYHTVLGSWSGPWTGAWATTVANGMVLVSPYLYFADDSGWVLQAEPSSVYKDSVASDGTGGLAVTGTLQCRRMFGQDTGQSTAKTWKHVNVLATLTSGATAPTVATASVYGGTSTQTFVAPTSTQQVYYNAAGGAGPYVDVTITDTGTTASQYASVDVTGFTLGIR